MYFKKTTARTAASNINPALRSAGFTKLTSNEKKSYE